MRGLHAADITVKYQKGTLSSDDLYWSGCETGVRVLVTMLPTPDSVREVYTGAEGVLAAAHENGEPGARVWQLS